ncbi:aldehyde dehydrogenase family protein [Nocardioides sp. SYSU DS0663]|uniref:aldehyde dehydrogenase family protein n=1 Tax=Nocardioides sp. SYSU DS0663 TaxID=3416445 RepID=UPI003F4B3457
MSVAAVEDFRDAVHIDGRWISIGSTVEVENPATQQVIGSAANGGAVEVNRAVRAARAAFATWSQTSRAERADHLDALLRQLRTRHAQLVATTVAEVGAPVQVATEGHVDLSLEILQSYVELLREPEELEQVANSLILREPAGVVGCITPWNDPLYQLMIKVAAALAAGCAVVAKPAELTPLTAHLLLDAAVDAGLPASVLNLVPGSGREVGQALVTHPDVDVISFTGSTAVGSAIAATAAATLKRVSLELGGKSASVVLPDADLRAAVRATVDSATCNTGQTCSAWTRLLVPADRYEEAVAAAVERAGEFVVGDPLDPATEIGPLVSALQRQRVTEFLQRAEREGAVVDVAAGPELPVGHYCRPAVVSHAERDSEIAREEVFGPVLVVLAYHGEDDAVAVANDTDYGLAGAVWSADEDRALAFAQRMRTGQVDINGAAFNVRAPFGGYKRSGYGRELGRHGLDEFTGIKAVQR